MISARPQRWARHRLLVRVGLALGLAAAAVVVSQGWITGRSAAEAAPAVRSVDVRVTARPVAAGAVLTAADLRWQAWPAGAVGAGWRLRGSGGGDTGLIGAVAPQALAAGVPVSPALLVAPGAGSVFAAAIRPGWRAISIAVGPAAGLAGFVAPGDRVDVLLTQIVGGRRTAQILLGDIGVLGVDQRQRGGEGLAAPLAAANDVVASATAAAGAAPPDLVTLEVTPYQAQALAIAADLGTLSLVLRGPGADAAPPPGRRWDNDVTGLSAALFAATGKAPAVSPAPVATLAAPPPAGIEIVYGLPPAAPAPVEVAK